MYKIDLNLTGLISCQAINKDAVVKLVPAIFLNSSVKFYTVPVSFRPSVCGSDPGNSDVHFAVNQIGVQVHAPPFFFLYTIHTILQFVCIYLARDCPKGVPPFKQVFHAALLQQASIR